MSQKTLHLRLGIVVTRAALFLILFAIPNFVFAPSNVGNIVLSPLFWPYVLSGLAGLIGLALLGTAVRSDEDVQFENEDVTHTDGAAPWLRLAGLAVIMVLVIFYMIVLEKTRDIGILRSLGASRAGVASIFLTYAGAIGVVGATLGTIIGYLVVTYINEIHAWLGEAFGIVIWDRRVYFFDNIPSQVNPVEVAFIVVAAIVASVLGAVIPSILAAFVDPVKSLRYE